MQQETRIAVDEFCSHHNIEPGFITTLYRSGLIETETENEVVFLQYEQLPTLEKLIRLRYELDINVEGIEAISYLLQRLEKLQEERFQLREQLRVFTSS